MLEVLFLETFKVLTFKMVDSNCLFLIESFKSICISMATLGNSTNIFWHDCPVGQKEREKLLNQKGCVVWITGLSGSGSFLNLY